MFIFESFIANSNEPLASPPPFEQIIIDLYWHLCFPKTHLYQEYQEEDLTLGCEQNESRFNNYFL